MNSRLSGLSRGRLSLPLSAPYGEQFQYSNQMYAIGGYAAAVAAGAAPDDLYRWLSTGDAAKTSRPGGHAALHLRVGGGAGQRRLRLPARHGRGRPAPEAIPVARRAVCGLGGPGRSPRSPAREMARYLQTELSDGVAPDGTRVVSAENLDGYLRPTGGDSVHAGCPAAVC